MNDLNSTDIQKWWFWPANCMWSTHLLVKILNTCNLKNWIQNCKEIELAWGQVHNLEDDGGVTISILLTRKLNCFQNLIKISEQFLAKNKNLSIAIPTSKNWVKKSKWVFNSRGKLDKNVKETKRRKRQKGKQAMGTLWGMAEHRLSNLYN